MSKHISNFWILQVLVISLVSLLGHQAAAVETVSVNETNQPLSLGQSLRYLVAPTPGWQLDDVIAAGNEQWRLVKEPVPSSGFSNAAYWFRFDLHNSNAHEVHQLLELSYPVLDYVDLFVRYPDSSIQQFKTGDRRAFFARPISHRHFLFPLQLHGDEKIRLWLRVETSSALQIPLRLWQADAFWIADQVSLSLQMAYYGIMLVMVLYNFFIFVAIRDPNYLLYILFVSFFNLFQFSLRGFAYQYFWPNFPELNEQVLMLALNAAIAFGCFFTTRFNQIRAGYPWLYRWCYGTGLIAAGCAIAVPWAPYTTSITMALVLSVSACLSGLVIGLVRWYEGYKPAQYFTIAWLVFILGTLLFGLNKFGLIPHNLLTEHAFQMGAALEVVLLSFALASRIDTLRQEKNVAQSKAVAMLEKYRALYENAIEGMFQLNLERCCVNANRAMLRMFAYRDKTQLAAVGTDFLSDSFVNPQDTEHFIRMLREYGQIMSFEARTQRRDNSVFWGSWSARAVHDEQGQLLHYEGSLVDITTRKDKERSDQEKQAAEAASEAKTRFLAVMSHEIRTPLHGILGMLELLQSSPLTERQVHYATTAHNSGELLLTLVNDILDLSKIEANRLKLEHTAFEPDRLVQELAEFFTTSAGEKGLDFKFTAPEVHTTPLMGDPFRLRQVLSNLLSNAIKFTERGSIELAVKPIAETAQRLTLQFEVRDTGIGIIPEKLPLIFDAFAQADDSTTRQFGGTGLGLTICKRLVVLMGGTLEVDSTPGQGSTFWFRLEHPKAKHSETSTPVAADTSMTAANHTPRLLLVEDNPVNQIVATSMLEKLGLQVDSVNNGQEAISACQTRSYHAILMDCQMPGLDGYQTTTQLRQLHIRATDSDKRVPIIALTANALESDRQRCLAVGMNDYLAKPFALEQLQAVLRPFLNLQA